MDTNFYNGNPRVKKDGVTWKYSEQELHEYIKCKNDPVYFICNYTEVVHLDHGQVKFKLRGYQEKMVQHFNDNRFSVVLSGRQSGKTLTSAGWLLWYICFHSEKTVAILANKGAIAREILYRITSMLETVPFFLQPGVKELNKGSITFSNRSKIIAAATSASSIRGLSCVPDYTRVAVRLNSGKIKYDSIRTFLDSHVNDMKEILTDSGFKKFDGFIHSGKTETLIRFYTNTGLSLDCTPDHRIQTKDLQFVCAEDLNVGDELHGITKTYIVKKKVFEHADIDVYDALNVEDTHSYVTNGLISHNCSVIYLDEFAFVNDATTFFTATFPVISSGDTTKVIVTSTPNGVGNMFYKMWEEAVQGRSEFKPMKIDWWEVPGRDDDWKRRMISNTSELQFQQEYSCLHGDSTITLRDKDGGHIIKTSLEEYYNSFS